MTFCLLVDCEWSEWEIGRCSKTCGRGTRTNSRYKEVEEEDGGECRGRSYKKESCNRKDCPGDYNVYRLNKYIYTYSMNKHEIIKHTMLYWQLIAKLGLGRSGVIVFLRMRTKAVDLALSFDITRTTEIVMTSKRTVGNDAVSCFKYTK